MTPEDIQWPPPQCTACGVKDCDRCDPLSGDGCDHDCPWLYPEEAP